MEELEDRRACADLYKAQIDIALKEGDLTLVREIDRCIEQDILFVEREANGALEDADLERFENWTAVAVTLANALRLARDSVPPRHLESSVTSEQQSNDGTPSCAILSGRSSRSKPLSGRRSPVMSNLSAGYSIPSVATSIRSSAPIEGTLKVKDRFRPHVPLPVASSPLIIAPKTGPTTPAADVSGTPGCLFVTLRALMDVPRAYGGLCYLVLRSIIPTSDTTGKPTSSRAFEVRADGTPVHINATLRVAAIPGADRVQAILVDERGRVPLARGNFDALRPPLKGVNLVGEHGCLRLLVEGTEEEEQGASCATCDLRQVELATLRLQVEDYRVDLIELATTRQALKEARLAASETQALRGALIRARERTEEWRDRVSEVEQELYQLRSELINVRQRITDDDDMRLLPAVQGVTEQEGLGHHPVVHYRMSPQPELKNSQRRAPAVPGNRFSLYAGGVRSQLAVLLGIRGVIAVGDGMALGFKQAPTGNGGVMVAVCVAGGTKVTGGSMSAELINEASLVGGTLDVRPIAINTPMSQLFAGATSDVRELLIRQTNTVRSSDRTLLLRIDSVETAEYFVKFPRFDVRWMADGLNQRSVISLPLWPLFNVEACPKPDIAPNPVIVQRFGLAARPTTLNNMLEVCRSPMVMTSFKVWNMSETERQGQWRVDIGGYFVLSRERTQQYHPYIEARLISDGRGTEIEVLTHKFNAEVALIVARIFNLIADEEQR